MDFISGREGMAEIFMTLRWSQVGFQLVETICSWKQHCERARLPKEALWWLLLKPVKFRRLSGVAWHGCMSLWYTSGINSQHQQRVWPSLSCAQFMTVQLKRFRMFQSCFGKVMWFFHEKKQSKKAFLFERKGHVDYLKILSVLENVSILCCKPPIIIPLYFYGTL